MLIPKHVPSHPALSQKDQHRETGGACAANAKTLCRQQQRHPQEGGEWAPPHAPPPQAQTLREQRAPSIEERTILYSSQTSLKGMSLF